METIRVLVISYGAAVGKTSLISRFVNDTFTDDYHPTTTEAILSKTMTVDGKDVQLQVLDTPGDQTAFSSLEESIKYADAFMVVHDVTQNPLTCSSLRFSIIQEKQMDSPPMVLVATKSDTVHRGRKMSGIDLAQQWDCPFLETSARDGININKTFAQLVRESRSRRRVPVRVRKRSAILKPFRALRAWDSVDVSNRELRSGWMHKRGASRVLTNWQRRFVIAFDDGTVQYFANDDDAVPCGEFTLRDVWNISPYADEDRPDGFVLQTHSRDWHFSCVSEEEKNDWLDVFVRFIAHYASRRSSVGHVANVDEPIMQSDADAYFERRLSLTPVNKPKFEPDS